MARTVLIAIAILGISIGARANADLAEALYGYRHDVPTKVEPPIVRGQAPPDGEADPLCGQNVAGVLVLDRNVDCSGPGVGLRLESGSTLDLNGFTFEGYVEAYARGGVDNVTIRNGTIARGHIDFVFCRDCLIEDVRVIEGQSWVVEPGLRTRINRCYFADNHVAVDLYLDAPDSYVVIENSTFENNRIAINNAKHNHLTVSGSVFRSNQVGVRLYAELGNAVSFDTVVDNEFAGNEVGVAFILYRCNPDAGPSHPSFRVCHEGNVVAGNRFTDNRSSGVLFGGPDCVPYGDCTRVDASIEDNFFSGNGFASTDPLPSADDGITVLGPPEVVDEVQLAGNFAVENYDLAIEAPGVIDGGGNLASGNGNPLQCVGVTCTPAWPEIDVARDYDFGRVDLGTRSTRIVTIANTGGSVLTVEGVEILPGADPGFEIEEGPTLAAAIEPGESVDVVLTFAPVLGGEALATLRIASDDAEEPVIDVSLGAIGVPYDAQAMEILDRFDTAVASGDVTAIGRWRGALHVFRSLIESSQRLLERGHIVAACTLLEVARLRADDEFPPPDLVGGSGRPELAEEIAQLRINLGCDFWRRCGRGFELAAVVPPLLWLGGRRRRRLEPGA